jgi:hypothetical protein
MKVQIFKNIFYYNNDLSYLIPNLDNIIRTRKSLKTDLCNFFRRIKLKEYQVKNKDRIRELNRQLAKKKYHSSLEERNKLIAKSKLNYQKKRNSDVKNYEKFILE